MLTFMYSMMMIIFEHTHNRHIRGEYRWGGGGGDNKYKPLNVSTVLVLFFILSLIVFYSLSCFHVGIVYIPETKAHISQFFDPQPKNLCSKCVDHGTKRPKIAEIKF